MDERFDSDPKREVFCRICALDGIDKRVEASRLIGHIGGKHSKDGWNKTSYLTRFADAGADKDFAFFKPPASVKNRIPEMNARRKALKEVPEAPLPLDYPSEVSLSDPNRGLLTPPERQFYDEFYLQVLQAVDRDEVQMPAVSSLAMDVVILQRLRRKQLDATSTRSKSLGDTDDLEKAITNAEKRIQASMKALCISREMLLKNQDKIKSTPAGIISGYLDEIENMSADTLDALVIDEKRVLARMHPRLEKFILSNAPDLKPEQDDDDNATGGNVLGLDEALRKAGIAF